MPRRSISVEHPEAASGTSWTALLAGTLGLERFGQIRILVRSRAPVRGTVRLVVQAFGPGQVTNWGRRIDSHRAFAAIERKIALQELSEGLRLSIPHEREISDGTRLLAWLELPGREIEFGGLRAEPAQPLCLAIADVRDGKAEIAFSVTARFEGVQAA